MHKYTFFITILFSLFLQSIIFCMDYGVLTEQLRQAALVGDEVTFTSIWQNNTSTEKICKKKRFSALLEEESIIKYWLINQIGKNNKMKDVFLCKINPLMPILISKYCRTKDYIIQRLPVLSNLKSSALGAIAVLVDAPGQLGSVSLPYTYDDDRD